MPAERIETAKIAESLRNALFKGHPPKFISNA
jgi:hypothetical protein